MTDASSARATRAIDRRQLLKAGAWAAPAIVIAAAVPAASASVDPLPAGGDPTPAGTGTIAGGRLNGRLSVWNLNSNGTPGPIGWNGQIGYWTDIQPDDPATGVLPYVVAVKAPGSTTWSTVASGAVTIVKYQGVDFPNAEWGTDVMAAGTYTFRLVVAVTGGVKVLAEESVTL